MPALPARTTMSNPYPAPTDAAGRAWFLGLWDSFAGLLGSAATPASARDGLQLPKRAAKNLLVNPNFSVNQRGYGITGVPDNAFVRDKWTLSYYGGTPTLTSSGASTGRLTSIDLSGWLLQTTLLISEVTYTFSNTGTAKLRIRRVDDLSFIPYAAGPLTFTANSSTIPYEFAVSDGTLGTVLLEEGAFATEAEQRSDLEELQLCMRNYQRLPLSHRFPASSGSQIGNGMFHFPVPMAGMPTASFISGAVVGNRSAQTTADLSVLGGRFELTSAAAGDCYSLNQLYEFVA